MGVWQGTERLFRERDKKLKLWILCIFIYCIFHNKKVIVTIFVIT